MDWLIFGDYFGRKRTSDEVLMPSVEHYIGYSSRPEH